MKPTKPEDLRLAWLVRALRRYAQGGPALSPSIASEIAARLEGKPLRGRGRPRNMLDTNYEQLADFIELQASFYHQQGHKNPISAAIDDAYRYEADERRYSNKVRMPNRDSMVRNYRKGLEQLGDRDRRAAKRLREIEHAQKDHTAKANAIRGRRRRPPEDEAAASSPAPDDGAPTAIDRLAQEFGVTPFMAERMVRRGLKRLAKSGK